MKHFLALFLFLSVNAFSLPLSIVPKEGTTFPTEMTPGYNVTAYYTITNNTASTLNNLFVKYLPPNVSQVTTNGSYADTCGATFNLGSGESCTLQLLVSGPVTPSPGTSKNNLFVCLSGGLSGAGTSYPLQVSQSPWLALSISFEIGYTAEVLDYPTEFVQAYKDGGSNPITQSEWDVYTPPTGYTKNTTRYLQFDESISLGGPGDPIGTETYITTSDGYTWGAISNVISAMYPFDRSHYIFPYNQGTFYAGNLLVTPPPGVIKVSANYKPQLMKYYANENGVAPGTPGAMPILRYFIQDEWGNTYIMQASDYNTPEEVTAAFEAAVLPANWTKSTGYLSEDLILSPARGPANTFQYVLLRDNQNNTYDQISWGSSGIVVESQISESGMPIWGGASAKLLVISNSFNNLIVGGGGVISFKFLSTLTGGINTITDFNPFSGDTLDFDGQTYTTVVSTSGVQINLSGGATVILDGIYLFSNSWVVSN